MSDESFYEVTLTGESNIVQWKVLSNDEDSPRGQKPIIRRILLGAVAEEDEFNVFENHTVKDKLRVPITILNAGETLAVNPDIEFYETSATFKLIKGKSPIYIKDEVEVVDMEDEETDEEDEDEAQPKKKLKLENNADVKSARNKKK